MYVRCRADLAFGLTVSALVIDSHHHFWRYDPALYGWINDEMAVLKQDFLPEDLIAEADELVDAVITVQARQDLVETRWLLEIAHEEPFVLGVVGWVPLTEPNVAAHLDQLSQNPSLVGVRHVLQDEPDDEYALREDFNRGVAQLKDYSLAYDILIYERQLPAAIGLVDRHPDQVFVLDHVAKPRIRDGEMDTWKTNIRELARRENCYCKISGMVTEANRDRWSGDDLQPYFDTVLEAFGPNRMMFGSDWPVCLLACDYRHWYHLVDELTAMLSEEEQARIWGETAEEAYGLSL